MAEAAGCDAARRHAALVAVRTHRPGTVLAAVERRRPAVPVLRRRRRGEKRGNGDELKQHRRGAAHLVGSDDGTCETSWGSRERTREARSRSDDGGWIVTTRTGSVRRLK